MTTESTPKKGSNAGWYAAAAVVVIVIIVVGIVAYTQLTPTPVPSASPPPTSTGSTITVTLYGGEASGGGFGFGTTSTTITSPGPALTFKVGDKVTVDFHNASPSVPHNWAMVDAKATTANVVFGAQIQSGSNPLSPGGSGSVTFTVAQAGSYYYICQVPGHVGLGMWGTVTVNP
ncbi:MAG: plastocyanin/azurin family copper-binding protein [Candidatus Bathyarchaeia archaeon]